jgi:hypothetical protein
MKKNLSDESTMLKLEKGFNDKISSLVVATPNLSPDKMSTLQTKINNEIQVDSNELSQVASEVIDKDNNLSDTEVAIELLKYIANRNKSKSMRKIASKMLKERWWEK